MTKGDGAEKRPHERADEVVKETIDSIEKEEGESKASMGHSDVESESSGGVGIDRRRRRRRPSGLRGRRLGEMARRGRRERGE